MLKKYSELTEAQRKQVAIRFTDLTSASMFLYNFDGDRYVGRHRIPEEAAKMAHDLEEGMSTDFKAAQKTLSEALNLESKPKRRKK